MIIGGAFLGTASILSLADTQAELDLIVIDAFEEVQQSAQVDLVVLADEVLKAKVADLELGVVVSKYGHYPVPVYYAHRDGYIKSIETRCRSPGNQSLELALNTDIIAKSRST